VKINLNSYATVTLTQAGADIYNLWDRQWEGYVWWKPKNFVEGSEVKMPLWELFQIFGKHIHMGCVVPFQDNMVEVKEPA
jgi:hypothetical protein